MTGLKRVIALAASLGVVFLGISSAQAQEPRDRYIRLSFNDGRSDVEGLESVNAHLMRVGVRVFEVSIPDSAHAVIASSRSRALTNAEHTELLSAFALDRAALMDIVRQAGRTPAVEGGGSLSISEADVPPYPKVYDMRALDQQTVAFLMRKFGRLHVNRADSGEGIDEVMTVVSGGPFTWFFVLDDGVVGKVRFSAVEEGDRGWRISYPGLVPHGGYFDAAHGLVVANAHGPRTFVMRYTDDRVRSPERLNDNPWIDFSADPPRLLDQSRDLRGREGRHVEQPSAGR
jgi:hypothetical protein